MTVEHELTRELDIRFIDARSIVNDAKVMLSIQGYTSKEDDVKIRHAALHIFDQQPESSKRTMRSMSAGLEAVKISNGSVSSSKEFSDADSCHSFALSDEMSVSTGVAARGNLRSVFRLGRR
jgi:hypothetical protein